MVAINPQFIMDFESRLQVIQEDAYVNLVQDLWWQRVAKTRTSGAAKDILTWILSTAMIRPEGAEGNVTFEDLVSNVTEIETDHSGSGLRLKKSQLEDSDGNGLAYGAKWAKDIGAYMAYWPQKQVSLFLKKGHLAKTAGGFDAYDGQPFFSANHPLNPYRTSLGTFANVFTGAEAGAYPGACPIHGWSGGVTADVALENLAKVGAYISSIKMPNGEDPRRLRVKDIFCGPRLFPRVVQLTSAKFLAQAAASGGGSADLEAFIKALGYATPVLVHELAGFENDTSFIVSVESVTDSDLGACVYTERESFGMSTYGPMNSAQLSRIRLYEWLVHGRNSITAGHPYGLFKVMAT